MEKLTKCKVCDSEIASKAKQCPSCGAKASKPFYKKWWVWVIAVVVVIAVASGGDSENEKVAENGTVAAEQQSDAVKSEEKPEEIIAVAATQLYEDYDSNEVGADAKYKNKKLEVTGYVSNISVVAGSTMVTLTDGGQYTILGVKCTFKDTEEIEKVGALEKGQSVTVIGKCTGKALEPTLEKCIIK